MTTASEIITAAYREGNLLGINASPTTAQQTEGLSLLNTILLVAIGFDAGQELSPLNVGGPYNDAEIAANFIPENAQLVLNLTSAQSLRLHPRPYDGQRVAVADVGQNLSTYNLTLDGNGRTIEGAATKVLSTDGSALQWLYRADLGDWKAIGALALSDALPFPIEFDDYFRALLAARLNPRYGQELQQGSAMWFDEMQRRFEARYRRPRPVQDWGSPGLLNQYTRAYGPSSAAFARGRG